MRISSTVVLLVCGLILVGFFPARQWVWLALAGMVAGSGIGWLMLR